MSEETNDKNDNLLENSKPIYQIKDLNQKHQLDRVAHASLLSRSSQSPS